MKKKLVVSLLAASIALSMAPLHETYAAGEIVSVKLVNNIGSVTSLNVKITGKYTVSGDSSIIFDEGKTYTLKTANGGLSLYDGSSKIKDFASPITLIPENYSTTSYIAINTSYTYMGTMIFSNDGGYVRPVNKLAIEDYVKGVVPREMPSSWALEALKAQAIAARTYVTPYLSQVVEDTTKNQVYGGLGAEVPSTNIAVDLTSGQILTYNNKPISAVFSSSNGGFIASSAETWGGTVTAYLPSKADPFDPQTVWTLPINKVQIDTTLLDLKNPSAWWSTSKEKNATIAANLKNTFSNSTYPNAEKKIVSVTGVSTGGKDSSGRSTTGSITFTYFLKNGSSYVMDPSGNISLFTVTVDKSISSFRTLLGVNEFKSTLVSGVDASGTTHVISGKGFGHGVGMSQYGAKAMAAQGKTYTDILAFYYPGATLTAGSPVDIGESTTGTVVNASSLNLRSGPGTSYSILRSINSGEIVSILDATSNSEWYKVLYNGTIGYVSSTYIQLSQTDNTVTLTLNAVTSLHSTPNENTIASGTLPAGSKVTVVNTQGSWVQIQKDSNTYWVYPNKDFSFPSTIQTTALTSIHSSPNASSSTAVSSLSPQKLTVVGKQGDWYKVKTWLGDLWLLPNQNYYIPSTIKITSITSIHESPSSTSVRKSAVAPQTLTVVGKQGDWYKVKTWLGDLWILPNQNFTSTPTKPTTPTPTPTPTPKPTATTGIVNATSLNLRSGAGTNFSVVGTLSKGSKVTIVKALITGWYQVTYNNKTGYVSSAYITKSSSSTPASESGKSGVVTASSLNMRSGSSTSSTVLATLPKGTKVTITSTLSNGWYQISYNNKTGYVSADYIRV